MARKRSSTFEGPKAVRGLARPLGLVALALCLTGLACSCSRQEAVSPPGPKEETFEARSPGEAQAPGRKSPARTGEAPSGSTSASSASRGPGEESSAPERIVESISFDPEVPATGDSLSARVRVVPGTDDAPARFRYRWSVNGETVQDREDEVLDHAVKAGDFVEVEVIPADESRRWRKAMKSVRIANGYPEIVLGARKIGEDGSYSARVEASDPDGDPLTLRLEKAPPGMTLDDQGGIRWEPGPGDQGTFEIQVKALDDKGAETVLSYSIHISAGNSSP